MLYSVSLDNIFIRVKYVKHSMDERDLRIIEVLVGNARIPRSRIAEALGITETAVRKRISKLEKEGIILGYRAVVDYRKINMVQSFTGIDVDPDALINVMRELRKISGVVSLYLTTGDHNLIAEIICKDMDELEEIHEKIMKIHGVKRICPAIVTEIIEIPTSKQA